MLDWADPRRGRVGGPAMSDEEDDEDEGESWYDLEHELQDQVIWLDPVAIIKDALVIEPNDIKMHLAVGAKVYGASNRNMGEPRFYVGLIVPIPPGCLNGHEFTHVVETSQIAGECWELRLPEL